MSLVPQRPRILIAFGASRKADPATGPVVSIAAMMKAFESEFEFQVLARPGFGLDHTCVLRPGLPALREFLCSTPYDLVYMNSLFDRDFSMPILFLRRFGLVPRKPALLAPHGELLSAALSLKAKRKQAFLRLARALSLLDDVYIHSTNAEELAQARRAVPWSRGHLLAEPIRTPLDPPPHIEGAGTLRLAFLGRISEVKNLDFALEALAHVKCRVSFDIFGAVIEPHYWSRCEHLIASLPSHVSVRRHGTVPSQAVPDLFARTDLFFLPSKSENFGHAIFEALSCGVPVLIGDQTPWRNLAAQSAGWDMPLDRPERLSAAIDAFAALDPARRDKLRAGARKVAEKYLQDSTAYSQNRSMFLEAIGCEVTA